MFRMDLHTGPRSVNVVRMDQEIIEKIAAAIAVAERTKKWVATKAGIAHVTFYRKMQGGGAFTVNEVARIADALGIDPIELLPSTFAQAREAA